MLLTTFALLLTLFFVVNGLALDCGLIFRKPDGVNANIGVAVCGRRIVIQRPGQQPISAGHVGRPTLSAAHDIELHWEVVGR
jgi:hypothetical protein